MIKFLAYQLDFFKTPFFLRTNKREKTSTFLGLAFSLGIFIFLAFFFFSSDIFYHKRPQTSDQLIQLMKKENINLNKKNFGLLWSMTNQIGVPVKNDSIYTISFSQIRINQLTKSYEEYDEKKTHLCNESDFENERGFSRMNFQCLNNDSLNLNGGFEEETLSIFRFYLNICDNKTFNNSCKSPEIISEFFKDKFFNIYFKEANYDLNNYEEPITYIHKQFFWSLSTKLKKLISISIKKLEIKTDDGFFFQNENLNEGYKTESEDLDIDISDSSNILAIQFTSSSKKQYATRNYQKVQEVIAGTGGIFSFLSFLGFILSYHQNYLNRISIIMNELYAFPKLKPHKKNEIYNSSVKQKLTNITKIKPFVNKKKKKNVINYNFQNNLQKVPLKDLQIQKKQSNPNDLKELELNKNEFSENYSISHSDNEYIENVEQNFHSKNNSQRLIEIQTHYSEPTINDDKKGLKSSNLSRFSKMFKKVKNEKNLKNLHCEVTKQDKFHFTIVNFLVLCLKRCLKFELSNKELLFLKTERKYLKEIDLVSVLKKSHEIDKIKLLLFNERQLSLFNFLSKPMTYIKKNEENNKSPSFRMSEVIKLSQKNINFNNFFENYKSTLIAMKNSEIDKKLIRFLDEKANEIVLK